MSCGGALREVPAADTAAQSCKGEEGGGRGAGGGAGAHDQLPPEQLCCRARALGIRPQRLLGGVPAARSRGRAFVNAAARVEAAHACIAHAYMNAWHQAALRPHRGELQGPCCCPASRRACRMPALVGQLLAGQPGLPAQLLERAGPGRPGAHVLGTRQRTAAEDRQAAEHRRPPPAECPRRRLHTAQPVRPCALRALTEPVAASSRQPAAVARTRRLACS